MGPLPKCVSIVVARGERDRERAGTQSECVSRAGAQPECASQREQLELAAGSQCEHPARAGVSG